MVKLVKVTLRETLWWISPPGTRLFLEQIRLTCHAPFDLGHTRTPVWLEPRPHMLFRLFRDKRIAWNAPNDNISTSTTDQVRSGQNKKYRFPPQIVLCRSLLCHLTHVPLALTRLGVFHHRTFGGGLFEHPRVTQLLLIVDEKRKKRSKGS